MKKLASTILVLWSALVCAAFAPLYVPAINIVSAGNPCSSLDSSTTALVARMTVDPGCPRKIVINDLIVSLKTAGVWAKLDVLYLFAAADSQSALLNWVSTGYNATISGSPTFTVDRGFTGTGSGATYLNSNFNPTIGMLNFQRDSAHLSLWSRTSATASNSYGEAGYSSSGNVALRTRNNAGYARARINGGGSNILNSDGSGFYIGNRANSTGYTFTKNSTVIQTVTETSVALVNEQIYFLSEQGTRSNKQLASGSIGGSLTSTEITDFYNALQTYMTAVGAYP